MILLTYIKKFYEDIKKIRPDLYHKPLLLTLVNSVNTEDADLKLFFRELEKIGKGDVDERIFKEALEELWNELKYGLIPVFEDGFKIEIDEKTFKDIIKEEILNYVYNANAGGEIEVLRRQSNKKELAFKLKTSDRPFALIKIGDVSEWIKNELEGYEIQESFEAESFFDNLNREDSEISILMGSHGFYEGWDSNRPNVINFINIGIGEDARKFILQSIGRGVRIEPIRGKRKRLLELYNAREVGKELYDQLRDKVIPIESLFIFGTNRDALITVIQELEKEKRREGEHQLQLFVNYDALRYNGERVELLVPTYRQVGYSLSEKAKFVISNEDLELLKRFITYIEDDRILLVRYNTDPRGVKILKGNLDSQNNLKIETEVRSFRNMDLLINEFFKYLSIVPEEFKEFKELEEEIKHYKNIKVYLQDISELQHKIKRVNDYPLQVKELQEQYGKITPEEYIRIAQAVSKEEDFEYDHRRLKIKYIANHYYLPLIISEDEKIDYIQHIIKTRSEVKFIKDLEDYLSKPDSSFKALNWWMFSKLDETLDEIYIPYYNPNGNRISKFKPDFIFWLKMGSNYFIVFVDPKGIEHISGWAYKIDSGYKKIFEDGEKEKDFYYGNFKVKVKVKLRTDDISRVPKEYRSYWFDRIEKILEDIL